MTKKTDLPIGVYKTRNGKFSAKFSRRHVGTFDTVLEASKAYDAHVERISTAKQNYAVAKIYDIYQDFRSRDDGKDHTPIYRRPCGN